MRTLDCEKLQLSIVPGPTETSEVELSSDTDLEDQVELDPAEVVAALLEINGIADTSKPTSRAWEATLNASGMTMRFGMTLLEPDDGGPLWGGFSLHGKMTVDEICRVAQELRSKLGSVWIHDGECMMRTPDAFREAMQA